MNEIRIKRILLAGLATFIAWVVSEILLEQMMGRLLFGNLIAELWLQDTTVSEWGASNHVVNILIALLNSTFLVWLYASLRPMYGVGIKTALITSALGMVWGVSMAINAINLGLVPPQAGLIETAFVAVELPIAMLVGAEVYEGAGTKLADLR
jgi:hypothetical protein